MPKSEPKTYQRLPEFAGPDGVQVISYSEADAYRQCPLKHLITYKERWKKPVLPGSALSRGSLWHQVMEVHYGVIMAAYTGSGRVPKNRHGKVLADAWQAVRPYLFDSQSGAQDEDQVKVQWMYEGYVEYWGVDDGWQILAMEYPFELALPDYDGNDSPYAMKGKIDIVAVDLETGGTWIWDHKSGANLPTQKSLEIDDQFGGYTWAMNKLGMPVVGSMHNAARTTMNKGDLPGAILNGTTKKQTLDQRFSRTFLNRTKQEQKNVALDFFAVAANAYPVDGASRPVYSSPNPDSCKWKCDIKDVHLLARQGRDIHQALAEYGFAQDFTRH